MVHMHGLVKELKHTKMLSFNQGVQTLDGTRSKKQVWHPHVRT